MKRTSLTLALTLALTSAAYAQPSDEGLPLPPPPSARAQQESISYEQLVAFMQQEEAVVDAAALELNAALTPAEVQAVQRQVEAQAAAAPAVAGDYLTNPPLTRSKAALSFRELPDGTYAVTRTYTDKKGKVLSELRGVGALRSKKSFLGLQVMKVTFSGTVDGAATRLQRTHRAGRRRAVVGKGSPYATYKFKPETGMIKEYFHADSEANVHSATGWREGSTPISLRSRIGANTRFVAGRFKAKVQKAAHAVRDRVRVWRANRQPIGPRLAALKDRVVVRLIAAKTWTVEKAIAAGHWTKEKAVAAGQWTKEKAIAFGQWSKATAIKGVNATKRAGRVIRTATADALDGSGDLLKKGAEKVRPDAEQAN